MAQLQSLFTNIALGLRRLEAEEEAATAGAEQPANPLEDRARRTTLKIANAANRSSWCSCCEMACFLQTGALVRKTHRPVAIFLSRPLFLYEQCRRLLHSSHEMLIEAQMPCDAQARHVDVLCFTEADTDKALQPVAVETDAKNNDEDVRSNSSEESNSLDHCGLPEDAHADCPEGQSCTACSNTSKTL